MSFVSIVSKSWKSFVGNKRLGLIAVAVDFVFVYAIVRLHYSVFSRASEHLARLTQMIGEQARAVAEAETLQNISFGASQEFAAEYHLLLQYIFLFLGGAAVAWLACKGIVWFLAHKTLGKKVSPADFALKFLGMSLLWILALVPVSIVVLKLVEGATSSIMPVMGLKAANMTALLVYWAFAYFVFASYGSLPANVFRSTFVACAKAWRLLLPVHIIGAAVLFMAVAVPFALMSYSPYCPLVFGIVVSLPAVAWTRVLWVAAVKKVVENE